MLHLTDKIWTLLGNTMGEGCCWKKIVWYAKVSSGQIFKPCAGRSVHAFEVFETRLPSFGSDLRGNMALAYVLRASVGGLLQLLASTALFLAMQ